MVRDTISEIVLSVVYVTDGRGYVGADELLYGAVGICFDRKCPEHLSDEGGVGVVDGVNVAFVDWFVVAIVSDHHLGCEDNRTTSDGCLEEGKLCVFHVLF